MGKWLQFRDFYQREIIDLTLRPSGKEFDFKAALDGLQRDANTGIMFERPASVLEQYRPRARLIAGFIALLPRFLHDADYPRPDEEGREQGGVFQGWLPWIMLTPAVASIALWVTTPSPRAGHGLPGLQSSGPLALCGSQQLHQHRPGPELLHYLITTFRFVLWNLGLAFCTPIILAFLLTEVPRFKVFFRTLFFLPR